MAREEDTNNYISSLMAGGDEKDEKAAKDRNIRMQLEREAESRDRIIVRFKNIDIEDFTHSYRGISQTFRKGASLLMRLPEADHLATHLARKMLSREKKAKISPNDARGVALWTDREIDELKSKIITTEHVEDGGRELSQEELHKRDIENLNRKTVKKEKKESGPVKRKDIIAELEKRGVKVDTAKGNDELIQQLMELESQG